MSDLGPDFRWIDAANTHRDPESEVHGGGPPSGHTFEISVRSRMSGNVVNEHGEETHPHSDADWFGPPWSLRVRAWNQRDALRLAATLPITDWERPGIQRDEEIQAQALVDAADDFDRATNDGLEPGLNHMAAQLLRRRAEKMTVVAVRTCGCHCHVMAGISHVVACCDQPPMREIGGA